MEGMRMKGNRTIKQRAFDTFEDVLDWLMYQWDDTVDTYGRWLAPIALVFLSLVCGALIGGMV
jgi:hypothetical protein